MKRNQIYCVTQAKPNKPMGKRLKILGKWCVAFTGFPLAYVILPISCCVRNPGAIVLSEDLSKEERPHPVAENLMTGIWGLMTGLCCCGCCCGYCGTTEPKDF